MYPSFTWDGSFELVVSERLLSELSDVLMRERFRRYATVEEVADPALTPRQFSELLENGNR